MCQIVCHSLVREATGFYYFDFDFDFFLFVVKLSCVMQLKITVVMKVVSADVERCEWRKARICLLER